MCGIFIILNCDTDVRYKFHYSEALKAGIPRGPDLSTSHNVQSIEFVFHRLSINGLDQESGQPMKLPGVTWVCNGEIYNHKELMEMMGIEPKTNSDCEVIGHLFLRYGMERTLAMLDGVFSLALHYYVQSESNMPDEFYVARDPYGVRPLFIGLKDSYKNPQYVFASEMKVLNAYGCRSASVQPFQPGSYSRFIRHFKANSKWEPDIINQRYHITTCPREAISLYDTNNKATLSSSCPEIYQAFCKAVKKRVENADRPVGCLLSGGLDSSLVAALAKRYYHGDLHTFAIGMPGSKDLENAKIVADHIGSIHHEVILSKEQFFSAIPDVIKAIESYDTTTVRASVGNYLIAEYIRRNTDIKVVLNGDGSDEVTGGYIYFHKAPSDIHFDCECRRLLDDIHIFDVLRSDRSISSHGLEARTPFLDKTFVQTYLSQPIYLRNHGSSWWNNYFAVSAPTHTSAITEGIKNNIEKLLLRFTVASLDPTLLPDSVLWRGKEAFSDGVSGDQSWHHIIQKRLCAPVFSNLVSQSRPGETLEATYYRVLFEGIYGDYTHLIPYRWMPKWVEATDPSARELKHYSKR
jgi:asparagine synthase (glutamine-hydrolysing)